MNVVKEKRNVTAAREFGSWGSFINNILPAHFTLPEEKLDQLAPCQDLQGFELSVAPASIMALSACSSDSDRYVILPHQKKKKKSPQSSFPCHLCCSGKDMNQQP